MKAYILHKYVNVGVNRSVLYLILYEFEFLRFHFRELMEIAMNIKVGIAVCICIQSVDIFVYLWSLEIKKTYNTEKNETYLLC